MEKKSLVSLLIILLALSYVIFVTAVPATRSLILAKEVDPSAQNHQAKQEVVELKNSEVFKKEEGGSEDQRKMMMDVADYSGPRANPAHQPKSPGKPN